MNIKQLIASNNTILKIVRIFGSWGVTPVFLLVHLTFRCNGECPFCYFKKDQFYDKYGNDMDLAGFKKNIVHSSGKLFLKPRIHLFGGEPLVYPYYYEILT